MRGSLPQVRGVVPQDGDVIVHAELLMYDRASPNGHRGRVRASDA